MIKVDLGKAPPGATIDRTATQAIEIASVVQERWWGQPVVSFTFNDTRVTLDNSDSAEDVVHRYHTARRLGIDS